MRLVLCLSLEACRSKVNGEDKKCAPVLHCYSLTRRGVLCFARAEVRLFCCENALLLAARSIYPRRTTPRFL